MRLTSILIILAGMLLIALGRYYVRRARRPAPTFRARSLGWPFTLLGFLILLAGILLW